MMHRVIVFILLFFPSVFCAQSFSGLGENAKKFPSLDKNYVLQFPKDHQPHNQHRIEWWYLTANLKTKNMQQYGIQWTLFRNLLHPNDNENKANAIGWENNQLWVGHAALTSSSAHYYDEKVARGGTFQAGVSESPFNAWIDDWELKGKDWSNLTVQAQGKNFSYKIKITSERSSLVSHGSNGYSIKSLNGGASFYYSQPFFKVKGWLIDNGEKHMVEGVAWLDREWSSQLLKRNQSGWDWISLHLNDGSKLMVFRVRATEKKPYLSGTFINHLGRKKNISMNTILLEPTTFTQLNQRTIPTAWHISIPHLSIDIKVNALNRKAYMNTSVPYWEGPINVTGSHEGVGYLEMTGY